MSLVQAPPIGEPSSKSALDDYITSSAPSFPPSSDPIYLHLAQQILHNLQHQHDWTNLSIHTHSPLSPSLPLARPIISGLAPHRVYIHPDEQIELLKARVQAKDVPPEREWVLPSHLREKWSLRRFAEIFDAVGAVPPEPGGDEGGEVRSGCGRWRTVKRVLLATVDDDSTVVYYVVHDGVVKPRQN